MGLTKKNIKSRSKKQKGRGTGISKPGRWAVQQNSIEEEDPNSIEEEDPNSIDDYLGLAIEEETPIQVNQYLKEGANPNITILDQHNSEEIPAIIYAARHIKSPKIMELLVERGASMELNDVGTTPLIEAAEWGNLPAVKYLLSIKEVDINATTGSGVTAIGYAVLNEDIPMISLMLEKRKGKIDFNYTAFGTDNENVIEDATNPEVAKILKKYAIEQQIPIHLGRQDKRLQIGRVMDKKRMPGDLTHKIITEHFGGKTQRKKRSKKKGGSKTQKSKKVVFKKCDSDMDCTLDNPECDTKNNICIQKFKYIGGKTRKKMKKKVFN
jgi:hypothetical protein